MEHSVNQVTGTPNLLRLVNRNLILQTLEQFGPLSRAELAKHLSISPPTVSALVDELSAEDLVEAVGIGKSSGGRRPTLLRYKPEGRYVLGLDIRKEEITAIWTDFSGKILERYQEACPYAGEDPYQHLEHFLQNILESHIGNRQKLAGIGIAVPGTVHVATGEVLLAPELNWVSLPLKSQLEDRFQIPILVDNDVNLAVLGESWKGAAQGQEHIVLIAIGTGIGSGVILNGELFRGSSFSAGEIGHFVVDPETLKQRAEGFGPFEQAYSLKGLRNLLKEKFGASFAVADLESAIRKENPQALELFESYARSLAFGVANTVNLLNPQTVIFTGQLFESIHGLIPEIAKTVQKLVPAPVQLTPGLLGKDSVPIGAVHLVLRNMMGTVLFRMM